MCVISKNFQECYKVFVYSTNVLICSVQYFNIFAKTDSAKLMHELQKEHVLNTHCTSCPAVVAQGEIQVVLTMLLVLLKSMCLPVETLPLRQGFYMFL